MKCPSCNKFCGLEMQDPEVNDIDFHVEGEGDDMTASVTANVRIFRTSECCGDECKEYNFDAEVEVSDEILALMRKTSPEVDFEAEESSLTAIEEGGGRYQKSYYGFELEVEIGYNTPTDPRTPEQQAELDKLTSDYTKTNASPELRARRAALFEIGRPVFTALGHVTLTDKVAASEMDELY